MDAADASCGKDADARHVGDHHGSGHGAGTVLALSDEHRQVPAAGLGDGRTFLTEVLDLLRGEARLQPPADDGNGGGHGPVLPDQLLHRQGRLHVLGVGHPVGDDGGFQGHHGLAGGEGFGDLGGYVKILVHADILLVMLTFLFRICGGLQPVGAAVPPAVEIVVLKELPAQGLRVPEGVPLVEQVVDLPLGVDFPGLELLRKVADGTEL